ncbi:MAG: DUF3244 domain-containing protein [Bacteroidales bacterium]|nr:DUF3244 domain-containing protein [Bacteroidales bacterium]MCF8405785.1 DUF3244 domain-containing protein [Bacteroidales bacterium]
MKTLILTSVMLAFIATGFAQETKQPVETKKHVEAVVIQESDDLLSLYLEKEPGEVVKIKIKEDDKVLYTRRIKKEASAKIKYDISQFPGGEYTVEVTQDKEVVYSKQIEKGAAPIATLKK